MSTPTATVDLQAVLQHLDEALATGRLTLDATRSFDHIRVWETRDGLTTLTLTAAESVRRVVVRASTAYDDHRYTWLVFRHQEHEAILRMLQAIGFVPQDVHEPVLELVARWREHASNCAHDVVQAAENAAFIRAANELADTLAHQEENRG